MKHSYRRSLLLSAALAALLPAASRAASPPPTDPSALKLVVGFPPGGALDTLARAVGERLRVELESPVLVDNRPGASTRLSIDFVRRAAPDGKTVLLASSAPFTIFPLTHKRLSYSLERDFIPVAHLVNVPTVVSAGASQPYRTIGEYLEWLRANPERGGFGLTNLGGALHFSILALSKSIGLPLRPVAYKGGAPLATDIIGGHIPVGTDALASQLELHRGGKLRILGVSGTERNSALPEVPTLKEAGASGFEHANASFSAFVPAGTPAETVARLEAALLRAVTHPAVRAQLQRAGLEATGYPGAQLTKLLETEREFWRPIVEASGFSSDE
jgi:tripartite-type tricarboxylate transporter receptor subunit TctC